MLWAAYVCVAEWGILYVMLDNRGPAQWFSSTRKDMPKPGQQGLQLVLLVYRQMHVRHVRFVTIWLPSARLLTCVF